MTERRAPFAAVLDSSALLALLRDEQGADRVVEAISERVAISAVNWCEVLGKLVDSGAQPAEAERTLAAEGILGSSVEVVAFDREQSLAAASLRAVTRARSLSLGDRACLSLAKALGVEAITADRRWHGLEHGVHLRLIR